MTAYYNEIDKKAAAWLRELIKQGHIAPGDVDERSIEDVTPSDLKGYTQCHFFAGIGIWSAALRGVGWSDDREVWTGSCPCQPFSAAGKRAGVTDERHLWPAWSHLVRVARPRVVFGEQVAGKNGLAWLDLVQTDLEEMGYASGAVPMAAAGFGAPHIRERTYWVAKVALGDANVSRSQRRIVGGDGAGERPSGETGLASRMAHDPEQRWKPWGWSSEESDGSRQARIESGRLCSADGVAHDSSARLDPKGSGTESEARNKAWVRRSECGRDASGVGNSESIGWVGWQDNRDGGRWQCSPRQASEDGGVGGAHCNGSGEHLRPGPTNGFWRDADWLGCRDNKFRPVEPGTFPLVNGASARVGRLRGYGNGIVKPQAEEFIKAVMAYLDLKPISRRLCR